MNILEQIVEHKKREITEIRKEFTSSDFTSMELFSRKPVSLRESCSKIQPFAVIAEIKRSSPSAGQFKQHIDLTDIATGYAENGAAGISVLTDGKYFSGHVNDLQCVRKVVTLPVLRKDFIIDGIQIYEAKAYGADAILLIATILEKHQISDLHALAHELGLDCLVELYDEHELDRIDFDSMDFLGINNRDLKTFTVDLKRSISISRRLPDNVTLVSESGIQSPDDGKKLLDANIHAALIGEYFMKSDNPGLMLKQFLEAI